MYNKCELLPGEIDLFRSALKRRVLAYKPHYTLSPSLSLCLSSLCVQRPPHLIIVARGYHSLAFWDCARG